MAGIDHVKEAALILIEFGMKLEEALSEDSPKGKKLSLSEAISLGVFIAPKAISLAGSAAELKEEFKDLDADELDELCEFVSEKLDLDNNAVEGLIEEGLMWLDATNDLRLAVRNMIKKEE